eukprot:9755740-Alexandrium_andersonii.AAC.1
MHVYTRTHTNTRTRAHTDMRKRAHAQNAKAGSVYPNGCLHGAVLNGAVQNGAVQMEPWNGVPRGPPH